MSIEVDLTEFNKAMKGLNEKMRRRKVMQIIRNVAGPAQKAAKQEVQMIEREAWVRDKRITTGNLEASIGRFSGKSKDYPNVMVGPRVKGKFHGWHGHLVHDGTKQRRGRAKKSLFGKRYNRGAAKPNPYMQRAFDKTRDRVRADFEKQIAKYIEKMANGTS